MKTVVVGGHTRNIGKTSVMARLIRDLKGLDWTAVKITQYGHGICSRNGEPCGCEPKEHPFVLTEEKDAAGRSDTSRFLAAGARRSLWLRVRDGQLGEALPLLERAWAGDDWVMIESNSVMQFLKPSLYLFVLDASQRDFKSSALELVERADALVPIGSGIDSGAWPELDPGVLRDKPVCPVPAGDYFSPALGRFVKERLLSSGAKSHREAGTSHASGEEQLCQH